MAIKYIVTHYAPDLDAIGSCWLLKRFNQQEHQQAQFYFVNPGEKMTSEQADQLRVTLDEVTHVDTGLGKFDHHQPDRALLKVCASSLVYDHLCQLQPALKQDTALKLLVDYITEIDLFQEIHWPDAASIRYTMMLHELIRGHELVDPQNDLIQLEFGFKCLDCGYQMIKQTIQANQQIEELGVQFQITAGPGIALETSNEEVIKQAQKMGFLIVLRKDPQLGHIRIKIRPDTTFDLQSLYEAIKQRDKEGSWFYHPGGKMLLNGSLKHRNQKPSSLTLSDTIALIKQVYG